MTIEIIAEIAQGYEGNSTLALMLAKAAVRSGADAVKFQLVYADELATKVTNIMIYSAVCKCHMKNGRQ